MHDLDLFGALRSGNVDVAPDVTETSFDTAAKLAGAVLDAGATGLRLLTPGGLSLADGGGAVGLSREVR